MVYLDEKTIQEIKQRIIENYHPQKIILFGSYANGTPDKDSDIDLLVIKESNLPHYKRTRELRNFLKDIIFPKDVIVLNQAEFDRYKDVKGSLAYEVNKKGRVLYG